MEKIRWGIAGPGRIAHKFAQAIKNVECAELVAVASRFEEEASEFAKEFDVPNVFVGYEEMADEDEKHLSLPRLGDGFEEEIYEASLCIMSGKRQSDIHPMSDSIKVLRQMDTVRKQIGVAYPLDGEEQI